MMMMDYNSQYTGSTVGSDTMSGSVSSVQPRIRTVRLVRPNTGSIPPPGFCRHGPNLGFSIRGGREHGTGFFVSVVEPGSEAHRQGLRVGDQIIRVNGFTVEDAIHKEVLQLISNHTHLTLKVRSVGIIPVKDRSSDALSWQIISDNSSSTRSSPQLGEKIQDVRISIMVAPRTKLGCGICKGPEWKPGIFVQFTKEGGIAREAGLRPGDQILFCNSVDFSDISFNEAVNIMKTSRQLDLIVRKSAGSELFPGESSGYNSSASSVTGDQSPSWSDSKRLSIVKEESLELEDRLSHLDRLKSKKWEKFEWDKINENPEEKPYRQFMPTIINLSENGTTIRNNGSDQNLDENSSKIADICLVSRQQETKMVLVEVHRSDVQEIQKPELCKSPSIASFNSAASRCSDASSSLSSAISQELQKRLERRNNVENEQSIDDQIEKKKILKGVDPDKQQQHSKLMDEFKKAHKRMFKTDDDNVAANPPNNELTDRDSSGQIDKRPALSTRQEASQERSSTLTRPNNTLSGSPGNAPPPPPLPLEDGQKTTAKSKPKAPPVPIKYSTLSQPPPCPSPDYDTISITSNSTLPRNGKFSKVNGYARKPSQNDSVEMESLESFKLNNPNSTSPKPPSTYFSNTMRKQQRPVSVVIGEYPSGTSRKQPGKLDFLQNGGDDADRPANQPITSQLASELAQTLNRSNLRRRTESMENLLNPLVKSQNNGPVTVSVGNGLKSAKSTTDLRPNRVTINILPQDRKMETLNGILKNGNGNHNFASHRPVVHQKSITFGEIPTVINDRPLHVT